MGKLSDYRLVCGGVSRTFGDIGVVACTITTSAGGEDFATITVDADLGTTISPFTHWARHDIRTPGNMLVWSGWLIQPTVTATGGTSPKQQQVFRLEGPLALLAGIPFQQPWQFPDDPTDPDSTTVVPADLSRTILNAGSMQVAEQIQQIFAWFQSRLPVGIQVGNTLDLPAVKPPEDEQSGLSCAACLQRELRTVPGVTSYWSYGANPTLNFRANSGAPTINLDVTGGTVENFQATARPDLLLREVTVQYVAEALTDPDHPDDPANRIFLNLTSDTSTASNGSLREAIYTCRLRGISDLYAAEAVPLGLAAALHEPFKTLTHTTQWAEVREDVDWTRTPGMAVHATAHGNDLLSGSRPILQRITRDIHAGTTAFQAGPPAHLDMDDILGLHRQLLGRTRNAARADGHGGPGEQVFGFKDVTKKPGTGGGALGPVLFVGTASGALAYFKVNADHTAYSTPPAGIPIANPP